MGEWNYSFAPCLSRHWMEMNGQFHAPSTLFPDKELPVHIIYRRLGGLELYKIELYT